MIIRTPQKAGNSLTSCKTVRFPSRSVLWEMSQRINWIITCFLLRRLVHISLWIHWLPRPSSTGFYHLPKRVLHGVRSSASSFNLQYLLASLRSSGSCLPLMPRLPIPSFFLSFFLSVTCFNRQFLCKVWPIQLPFLSFLNVGLPFFLYST